MFLHTLNAYSYASGRERPVRRYDVLLNAMRDCERGNGFARELPSKTSVNRQKLPAIIKTARTFLRVGRETVQEQYLFSLRSVFNPSVQTKLNDTFDPVERVLNNYL